jgi:hypothetical protein
MRKDEITQIASALPRSAPPGRGVDKPDQAAYIRPGPLEGTRGEEVRRSIVRCCRRRSRVGSEVHGACACN